MAKGKVTLRGRFSPGDKVELVGGDFPDPMIPEAVDTATVSKDGEVTFSDLEVGVEYVVRDEDRTRQARITARGSEKVEDVLVKPSSVVLPDDPPETPVEDVPRVVHEGARNTRMLTSTRGDTFAGETGDDKGRLTDPADEVADPTHPRQADYAGEQESDTAIGEARPVKVEKVEVTHLYEDVDDPVSHARENDPVRGEELQARPLTTEEFVDEVGEGEAATSKPSKAPKSKKKS